MRAESYLVTGYPGRPAALLVDRILGEEQDAQVTLLIPPSLEERSSRALKYHSPGFRERIGVMQGEAWRLDFGLAAREYARLAEEVTRVHHLCVELSPAADSATAERVNVGGARELIEFAQVGERLRRVVFYSTAMVSGTRTGTVFEDELQAGQRFRCAAEHTLARAERMLRYHSQDVPFTVLRPTHVVGDSRTGELDRIAGIYALVALLVSYPAELSVPLPQVGDVPLHIVPVDYVISAAYELGRLDSSLGRTFHLADPEPPTAREAFEKLAQCAGRRLPVRYISADVARGVLKLPGLRRLTGNSRAVLDLIAHAVRYDTSNVERVLERTGIQCPQFSSYCEAMVSQVRVRLERGQS